MQEHEKWLRIAREDLLAAKELIKIELFSAVVYHCQQSAEKALKAYLVFKQHQVERTHDLIRLLELCMQFDRSFEKRLDAVIYLTPFATKFRYPTEFDIPELSEAMIAVNHAENMLKLILKKVGEVATGQIRIFDKH